MDPATKKPVGVFTAESFGLSKSGRTNIEEYMQICSKLNPSLTGHSLMDQTGLVQVLGPPKNICLVKVWAHHSSTACFAPKKLVSQVQPSLLPIFQNKSGLAKVLRGCPNCSEWGEALLGFYPRHRQTSATRATRATLILGPEANKKPCSRDLDHEAPFVTNSDNLHRTSNR